MDLHDYSDVAQNYDLYLDVMYSKHDNYEGFKEFYLDLANEYGSKGVIDIACGTGAVLLHLAEAGIDIDGTDLSEAMCEVARKKAESKGLRLNIFPANMTDFRGDKKYSLAIIARSGFMHLLTPELQRAARLNIREHLIDDDPLTQIMYGNWKFETYDDAGNKIAERIRPLKMRQTYKQELLYLIEICGFEVVQIYGNYYKSVEETGNYIWVLKKKALKEKLNL